MKKRLVLFLFIFNLTMVPVLMKAQTVLNDAGVKVEGGSNTPFIITHDVLKTFPRAVVNRKDKDGNNHLYTGAALSDILAKAGTTLGKELKGTNLTKCLLVEAADGYQVSFAFAELDKAFTDRIIILADEMDGKPLPVADGPYRVVVEGEKKPARCIKQVTGMFIKSIVK